MFSDPFNDPFFNIMQFIFPIFFLAFFVFFIFVLFKGIKEWNHNNKQPIVPVNATIVAKRTSVSHHHHSDNHMDSSSTSYYVTFEYINGERQEFHVGGTEYGLMAEGDKGTLSFQGTRFIDFKREI